MPETRKHIVAVYPGSFDPVTHGHLNVIERASGLFNELVIGIGQNPDKRQFFTPQERKEMMQPHISALPNVRAETYEGLTIDFVRSLGGRVLVRGIRDAADLNSEMQQATVNQMIGGIETIFLMTSDKYAMISSSLVKQIVQLGGDQSRVERLVPENVAAAMAAKLGERA